MHNHRQIVRLICNCGAAILLLTIAMGGVVLAAPPEGKPPAKKASLVIQEQGSLAAGSQVLKEPGADGAEFHYDGLYAFYQKPAGAKKNSLVMWHGCLGAAWERTPHGGPGFQSLLLRRGFTVFVIDQPRISRGQRGLGAYSFGAAVPDDCSWTTFRYGVWFPPAPRTFFPGVQLSQDPEAVAALCQLRGSPGGPPFTPAETSLIPATAVLDLLDKKAGDTVLVTHSAGGIRGWLTRSLDQNDKVKGIVAYEPAEFIWPVGQMPPALPTHYDGTPFSPGTEVPLSDFMKLTTVPIQIVWGDNIPTEGSLLPGPERWRLRVIYAQQFVDLINSYGGNAEVLKLPEIGVFGNTHFPFFDLNNEQIADLMVDFLKQNGLDKH